MWLLVMLSAILILTWKACGKHYWPCGICIPLPLDIEMYLMVNVVAYFTHFLMINVRWILFILLGQNLFHEFAVITMACFLWYIFGDSQSFMRIPKVLSSLFGTFLLGSCLFCHGKKKTLPNCQKSAASRLLGIISTLFWLISYFGMVPFSYWSRTIIQYSVILTNCWCLHFLDKAKI